LGIERPSEQYGYNGKSLSGTDVRISAGWMNLSFKDTDGNLGFIPKDVTVGISLSDCASHSAFVNWGVTL
jgi:hypothetical protein